MVDSDYSGHLFIYMQSKLYVGSSTSVVNI